jgi:hypothetical protein
MRLLNSTLRVGPPWSQALIWSQHFQFFQPCLLLTCCVISGWSLPLSGPQRPHDTVEAIDQICPPAWTVQDCWMLSTLRFLQHSCIL